MKVTFVCPSFEALGIEYLSAVLKERGHSTSLVFDPCLFADFVLGFPSLAWLVDRRAEVIEKVLEEEPDLVAFSVMTNTYRWAIDTANAIKRRSNVPIVFGGVHVTSVGDVVLEEPAVDFIVRGEGEYALADLADSLDGTRFDTAIQNLGYRAPDGRPVTNPLRPTIDDLDTLPFPDKTLYDRTSLRSDFLYTVMAARGCTFACSFCNNSMNKRIYRGNGKWMRRRSPENVLAELRAAREHYRFTAVSFCDEIFTGDSEWIDEFCPAYAREIGVPYICVIHPSHLNPKLAETLASSGCKKVDVGVQTTDDELRKLIHRPGAADTVACSFKLLRERGVSVYAENIFGLPGQTEEHLVETARFYNENRPSIIKVYWLSYFPGTDIVRTGLAMGEIDAEQVKRLERGYGTRPFTAGGTRVTPEFHRIFTFFLFILILPRRVVDWALDRRLYRFLPSGGLGRISGLLVHLFHFERNEGEFYKWLHIRHYRYYLAEWLAKPFRSGRAARPLTAPPGADAARGAGDVIGGTLAVPGAPGERLRASP